MSPRFIVLEALDGVGKTTIAQGLAAALDAVAMNTPGDALRVLSGEVLAGLGPHQTARCLFYAGSVLARGAEARAIVDGGRSVVMDRYWLSTVAYARARGVSADLSGIEALVPPPDVTLLLTLDEGERRRRLATRGLTAADRETLDPAFRERVLAELRAPRGAGLGPSVDVDLTGAPPAEALRRVREALTPTAPPACPARRSRS